MCVCILYVFLSFFLTTIQHRLTVCNILLQDRNSLGNGLDMRSLEHCLSDIMRGVNDGGPPDHMKGEFVGHRWAYTTIYIEHISLRKQTLFCVFKCVTQMLLSQCTYAYICYILYTWGQTNILQEEEKTHVQGTRISNECSHEHRVGCCCYSSVFVFVHSIGLRQAESAFAFHQCTTCCERDSCIIIILRKPNAFYFDVALRRTRFHIASSLRYKRTREKER